MTAMHDTGRLDLDEPVPYALTPRGYAALVDDPGPVEAVPLVDEHAPAAGRVTLWEHVATLTAWLDDANPRTAHEIACRVMKLAEETGEVVSAYLGWTGQNPRKGTCATLDDLTAELCDVIVTAMIALATLTGTAAGAETRMQQHVSARFARLITRINAPADEWGCETCGAAYLGPRPDDGLCPACRIAA